MPSPPQVHLIQGIYTGTILPPDGYRPRAVEAFLGIPYAASTAGPHRFRPPQPLPPSTESFSADALGPVCPITDRYETVPAASEDCLRVNIYRVRRGLSTADCFGSPDSQEGGSETTSTAGPKLPVLIYVHGGAFNFGHGADRDLATFVAFSRDDIVAVGFNYRLGCLGFLPSSVTESEGVLNLGLMDQQMLFGWVRDNIAAFGGDADDVTVMGVSAGAHSVSLIIPV